MTTIQLAQAPRADARIVDDAGRPTPEFYRFVLLLKTIAPAAALSLHVTDATGMAVPANVFSQITDLTSVITTEIGDATWDGAKLTIGPKSAGLWRLHWQWRGADTSSNVQVSIRKNGGGLSPTGLAGSASYAVAITDVTIRLVAGDLITLFGFPGTIPKLIGQGSGWCGFTANRIGA